MGVDQSLMLLFFTRDTINNQSMSRAEYLELTDDDPLMYQLSWVAEHTNFVKNNNFLKVDEGIVASWMRKSKQTIVASVQHYEIDVLNTNYFGDVETRYSTHIIYQGPTQSPDCVFVHDNSWYHATGLLVSANTLGTETTITFSKKLTFLDCVSKTGYTKSAVSIVLVGLLVKVYDAPPPRPPLRSKKYYDGVPFDYDRDFDYDGVPSGYDKDDEATYGDHSPRREDEATYCGGVKDAADPKNTDDIKAKCDHSDDTYSKYETIGAVIDECDETKNAELHDANEYKTPDSIPNSIVVDDKDDSNGNNVKDTNTDKVHEYIDEKGRAWNVGSVCIRKNTKCIVKEIDYQYKCVIVAPLDDPNYEINTEFRLISVVDDDEDTSTPEGANGDAVSWSYRESDGSWIRYDNSTSQRLEAAFCLKRTSVILDDNNIEIKMVYSKQPRFAQISGSERTEVMREGPAPADFIKEMLKSADFY
eukprot:375083_1